jgi:hypothetical protein
MLILGVRSAGRESKNEATFFHGVRRSGGDGQEEDVESTVRQSVTRVVFETPVNVDRVSGRKYPFNTIPVDEKSKPVVSK